MGSLTIKECDEVISFIKRKRSVVSNTALKNIYTIHLNEFVERKNKQMSDKDNHQIFLDNKNISLKNGTILDQNLDLKNVYFLTLLSSDLEASLNYAYMIKDVTSELDDLKEYTS